MNQSQNSDTSEKLAALKDILSKISGGDDKTSQAQELEEKSKAYNFDPDNVAPPEVQRQLLDLLKWHDDVMRDIVKRMEMVPGLTDLMEEMSNALNAYIYTVIAPWLTPILTQATSALGEGSKAVIDSDDQYQVFDDPNASDPSHSLLSKDHFGLILNEPAGKIAVIVVVNTVQAIVKAWADDSEPDRVIDEVLEAFHHPYYASGRSEIQRQMFDEMQKWVGSMGQEASETISNLTKEAVREHKNKREGDDSVEPGYGGCGHGGGSASYAQHQQSSQVGGSHDNQGQSHGGNSYAGGGRQATHSGSDSDGSRQESSYGRNDEYSQGGRQESYSGRNESSYGRNEQSSYGQRNEEPSYQRNEEPSYGRNEQSSYGQRNEEPSYQRNEEPSYGRNEQSSYGRTEEPAYGRSEQHTYGRSEESSYGSEQTSYGRSEEPSYGRQESSGSYGNRQEGAYGGGERRQEGGRGRGAEGYGHSGGDHDDNNNGGGRGGYNPSYAGESETFGAERLNIQDNHGYEGGRDEGGYGRRNEYNDNGY